MATTSNDTKLVEEFSWTPLMADSAGDINRFLTKAKHNFLHSNTTSWVVLGNQAADMDSMVSSIAYALYLSNKGTGELYNYIPIINMKKQDFALRKEAQYTFMQVGIDIDALTFYDQVCLEEKASKDEVIVSLVDHNLLCDAQNYLGDFVETIIDHHEDERRYSCHGSKRIVEKVGSCATLVSELFYTEPGSYPHTFIQLQEALKFLLYATILIDTSNLKESNQRTTERDKQMVARLAPSLSQDKNEFQKQFYEVLKKKKFDQSELTTSELLRKDYKEWTLGTRKLGISSVGVSYLHLSTADKNFESVMNEFAQDRTLDIYMVMTSYFDADDKHLRELLVGPQKGTDHCSSKDMEDFVAFLKTTEADLTDIPTENMDYKVFSQLNANVSRKVLQPIVAKYLSL